MKFDCADCLHSFCVQQRAREALSGFHEVPGSIPGAVELHSGVGTQKIWRRLLVRSDSAALRLVAHSHSRSEFSFFTPNPTTKVMLLVGGITKEGPQYCTQPQGLAPLSSIEEIPSHGIAWDTRTTEGFFATAIFH